MRKLLPPLSPLIEMMNEDRQLVEKFQKGNLNAFEKLYEKYVERIYAFLMIKSGGNKALSQDVTSETFMKAFDKISGFVFGEKGSFSAWLYRIAYTSFIDAIKVKQADFSLDESLYVTTPVDYVDLFQKKEATKQILAYLDTLGLEKKTIFLSRVWEHMSYIEVAEIVEKTPENCRQEFSRTLKKIIEKFSSSL
ncbi:MAG: RNA polymerase sigma factor [Candidatus Absconditabacteria bacterium]|nr:RNA polymerase sigma factor [Candidatus Absconditabacteria bacterium]MDD3868693.1 RNA polymerase sigma factor [Candidatus Absconditabacteria bacterium]MDD4714383.1 RNA polymerase sigma factor [Candidatus Absconditabacteria bacterium]